MPSSKNVEKKNEKYMKGIVSVLISTGVGLASGIKKIAGKNKN